MTTLDRTAESRKPFSAPEIVDEVALTDLTLALVSGGTIRPRPRRTSRRD
jgi:hypothetical protein